MPPVKPVLSDHIKQEIFLAFHSGGCLLLHESGTESSLNGWSLKTGLTVSLECQIHILKGSNFTPAQLGQLVDHPAYNTGCNVG